MPYSQKSLLKGIGTTNIVWPMRWAIPCHPPPVVVFINVSTSLGIFMCVFYVSISLPYGTYLIVRGFPHRVRSTVQFFEQNIDSPFPRIATPAHQHVNACSDGRNKLRSGTEILWNTFSRWHRNMLYCIVLYCFLLYCIVLYCLYCIVCIVLYCLYCVACCVLLSLLLLEDDWLDWWYEYIDGINEWKRLNSI